MKKYEISDVDYNRTMNNFTYHVPIDGQREKYEKIRGDARAFAVLLLEYCPPSRERSVALTQLEDCVMWANAAIARNEGAPPEG